MQKITRNHTNHRCGASHQRAKLTTEQVSAMRAEYEEGVGGYEYLAAKYGCGVSTARDIVKYRTRWAS
ncbi:hypothetical protein AHFPHNDE_01137 [Pseudomonas sp. MM227]|uniref:hypothetical protein n=1 Tax=Pseudomonas sp. MM227 TaxID=3019968 RepID=UPI002220BF37|nr:hypothetical protein [Pseudomonas sp. MM227]CAI3787473.1 hypothetical protein AHFPHNDE_01137 [Pseudomonas sp. MM227]